MFALAIHGGAGLSTPEDLGLERELIARDALSESLQAGRAVLAAGGSAIDATIAAVCVMEDSEVFNAGKDPYLPLMACSMDASLMDGQSKRAGSLCGATRVRNPIEAARLVMDHTRHIMLYGDDVTAWPESINWSWWNRLGFTRSTAGSSCSGLSPQIRSCLTMRALSHEQPRPKETTARELLELSPSINMAILPPLPPLVGWSTNDPGVLETSNHRCRHLCPESDLRSVCHWSWRALHSRPCG